MKRHSSMPLCLGLAGACLVGTGQLAVVTPSATAAELKLAHWMSPRHSMHRYVMEPWSKQISEKSGGKLTVRIYPGGALGKGPRAQFKRALDGVADITFGLPGFTAAQFRRTGVIELPGVATSGPDGSRKLWKAMKQLEPEWKRVKVLGLWVGESQVLMSKDKPIRTVADLKGMKIRTPSKVQADMIAALGATPVPMPINRVYNALNTGVIDGVLTGPSTIRSFKFGEVARYFTPGLPLGRSPFFLVMNKRSWDRLPADQKQLIDSTTGVEFSARAGKIYDGETKKAFDSVRNTGQHEIIEVSPAERKKFEKIVLAFRKNKVDAMEKAGIPAKAILAAMGVSGQ